METKTSNKNGILFYSKDKISKEAKAKLEKVIASKNDRLLKIVEDFNNGKLVPSKQ